MVAFLGYFKLHVFRLLFSITRTTILFELIVSHGHRRLCNARRILNYKIYGTLEHPTILNERQCSKVHTEVS